MSERWTSRHGRIQDPHGCTRVVECRGAALVDGDETARIIAARLNGPSPAEVAALLRSVEWSGGTAAGDGCCPSCSAYPPPREQHAEDCKLDAMIKQCEGA